MSKVYLPQIEPLHETTIEMLFSGDEFVDLSYLEPDMVVGDMDAKRSIILANAMKDAGMLPIHSWLQTNAFANGITLQKALFNHFELSNGHLNSLAEHGALIGPAALNGYGRVAVYRGLSVWI